ncbi:hypothetical protein ES703_03774 [subsurface metagenome]
MISVELIFSIIAVIAALAAVFVFGMRMGRLEKDVEANAKRMDELLSIYEELLDKIAPVEQP